MWIGSVPAQRDHTWFLRSGNAGDTCPGTASQYVFGHHGLSNVSSGCGPGRTVPTVALSASALYVSFVSSTEKYLIAGRPPSSYWTRTPGLDVSAAFRSQRSAQAKYPPEPEPMKACSSFGL